MESGIHSVESGIQDSLGLPYMGRLLWYLRHKHILGHARSLLRHDDGYVIKEITWQL